MCLHLLYIITKQELICIFLKTIKKKLYTCAVYLVVSQLTTFPFHCLRLVFVCSFYVPLKFSSRVLSFDFDNNFQNVINLTKLSQIIFRFKRQCVTLKLCKITEYCNLNEFRFRFQRNKNMES